MHNILFSAGGLVFYSAPIFAGLAGLAAFLCLRALRGYMGLSPEDLWNLVLALVFGVLGGAVLLYLLVYNGGAADNLRYVAARGRFAGGSFWGSLWLSVAAAWLYCRWRRLPFRPVADGVGLSAVLALAVMRVGCLLHGCCHGTPSGLPWAVRFTDPSCAVAPSLLGTPLHPVQVYEALGCLLVFGAACYFAIVRRRLRPGGAFLLSVVGYSLVRLGADLVRAGDPGLLAVAGLTTSQLIAAASAAAGALWYRFYDPGNKA